MSPKTFRTTFRVCWSDTDAAQVVHFSNYFRFFEKAEEEFYRHLGFCFTDAKLSRELWFPRVEALCQYKKPARFNDIIEVELEVEALKEKSIKYQFRIFNKKTAALLANGYIIIVAADKQAGKATQIPTEIVEKLKPFCK